MAEHGLGSWVNHRVAGSVALAMAAAAAPLPGAAQITLDRTTEQEANSALATSLVLTDTEAVTFGFLTFDPEQLPLELDGEQFGSEETLERRRSVRSLTLPWSKRFSEDARVTPHIKAQLSYVDAQQDVVLDGNGERTSDIKDRVYGGYLEGGFSYQVAPNWEVELGLGAHVLQYDNRFDAGNLFEDVTDPATNGSFFDTSATALIGELQTRLIYTGENRGIPWKYQSTYSYYRGETMRTDEQLGSVEPNTWSWSNGVTVRWPLPQVFATDNKLRLLARRVDVGGDVTTSLKTRQYYEFGVGWLFEPDDAWFDNIGLSLSVNVGSALSGGSLVLLYNEDF